MSISVRYLEKRAALPLFLNQVLQFESELRTLRCNQTTLVQKYLRLKISTASSNWRANAKRRAILQAGSFIYQCNPLGLVEVMEYLRAQGRIEAPGSKQEPSIPKKLLTIELVPETCWFELVPETCWFSNVRSEVTNEDWEKLKQITFTKAERLCEVCGGRGSKWPVECHEIWDYNDAKHTQTLVGFIALCPSCHEVKHRGFANIQGRGEIADLHLARVNQWTMPKTKQYVDEQFQVWKRRSQHEWELDISWLEQFNIQPKAQEPRKNVVSEGKARNGVRVIKKSQSESSIDHFCNEGLF